MNTNTASQHKRTLRISFFVAVLGLIVVAAALVRSVESFTKNAEEEAAWQTSKKAAEVGALAMSELHQFIGYGGIIHNFKNYILRQDEAYLQAALDEYVLLEQVASKYLNQPFVTNAETEAYNAVLTTMRQYRDRALLAQQLIAKGESVKQIDAQVAVDDQEALLAVETIMVEWAGRQETFRKDFNSFFSYLRTQNQYGLILIGLLSLSVIGAVAASMGLRRVITLFEEENLRRQQAEASLTKHSRDLERSNKDLQQFAYVASHDLRSPLRAIGNLADWIEEDLEGTLEGEVQNHMRMMKARIKRLDKLLNDLLEYSRASNKKLSSESTNLKALIEDVKEILVTDKHDSLVAQGFLGTIDAPKAVIATAIRNLVNNALKHHDKEQKTLTIQVAETDDDYLIRVIDDGPGIPAEFQEKAFQMFTTLQSRDEVEGSGMGLALVSRQLQNYGGGLSVRSPVKNNRGTEFIIQWPKQPQYENPSS